MSLRLKNALFSLLQYSCKFVIQLYNTNNILQFKALFYFSIPNQK